MFTNTNIVFAIQMCNEFVTSKTKQSFVSRTNECTSGWTLISSIGDVSVSIAILTVHRSTI